MFEYAKALAEYTADKKLMERDQAEAERKTQEARDSLNKIGQKRWTRRVSNCRISMT